jgi:arylsulfatase A-like enzyme
LSANWDVPLDDTYPTLAEVLSSRGYVTAGFVGNQHYCSRVHGLARGFLHYEDFNELGTEFVLSCQLGRRLTESSRFRRATGWKDFWGRKTAETVDRDFLRWIDRRPDRPFFAFLNYYDAHQPYRAPAPFDEQYGPSEGREGIPFRALLRHAGPVATDALTPRQCQAEQDAYDGSIAYLDACLGRLLDELEARGILDNTLVIVMSDHGEHFGEHGLRDHGNSLYRSLLQVPLVIRCPGGQPTGLRLPQIVSLRDLPATVMDLVGRGDRFEFPGTSLRRCWDGSQPEGSPGTAVFASLRPPTGCDKPEQDLDAVIAGGLHYIACGDGHEELFDFLHDAGEAHDLSKAENMHEAIARLRDLVARRSTESKADLAAAFRPAGVPR